MSLSASGQARTLVTRLPAKTRHGHTLCDRYVECLMPLAGAFEESP